MTSQPLVTINGGDILTTTSLAISNHFGRRHKDVLRAIEQLDCSPEFARRNFAPGSYQDGNQQQRPMYTITRDGFVFLCMGFTGSQAALWKERYIKAFSEMEEELIQRRLAQHTLPTGQQSLALPEPTSPDNTITLSKDKYIQLLEAQVHLLQGQGRRKGRPAPRPLTADEKAKILTLREGGLQTMSIARTIGRSRSAVRSVIREAQLAQGGAQ